MDFTTVSAAADAVIDRPAVLERFEGDWDLIREVAELLLEDCPRRLDAVRQALAAADCEALQLAAHSLKGSASNFSAADVVRAALCLEMLARSGDLTNALAASATVEREVARLTAALVRLIQEAGAGGDHAYADH